MLTNVFHGNAPAFFTCRSRVFPWYGE
jgi:hypothetical protein